MGTNNYKICRIERKVKLNEIAVCCSRYFSGLSRSSIILMHVICAKKRIPILCENTNALFANDCDEISSR